MHPEVQIHLASIDELAAVRNATHLVSVLKVLSFPPRCNVSIDEELAQAFRLRSSTQVAACFCILLTFGTPPHMLLRPNRQNGLDLVPGIGDAGDRLYLGTNATDKALPLDDDEGPSKKPKNSAT